MATNKLRWPVKAPAAPLECAISTRGRDDDFVGDLVKLGGDAMSTRSGDTQKQGGDGMAQLLGAFGKVIASGDSSQDIQIRITPLDENGRPIESQAVGSVVSEIPPPIPNSINIPATNGRLFVPMYQLAGNSKAGAVQERRITCTPKGEPVLETIFVLQ
jgi:hypothetical protein